jgi:urate oxidase
VRDKYTTLKEVDDRILSTSIDLTYTFSPVEIPKPTDADVEQFAIPVRSSHLPLRRRYILIIVLQAEIAQGSVWDTAVPANARKVTLDIFSSDNSASVQVPSFCPFPYRALSFLLYLVA